MGGQNRLLQAEQAIARMWARHGQVQVTQASAGRLSSHCCGSSGHWCWLCSCNGNTVECSLSKSVGIFVAKLENCQLWKVSTDGNSSVWLVQSCYGRHGHQEKNVTSAKAAWNMELLVLWASILPNIDKPFMHCPKKWDSNSHWKECQKGTWESTLCQRNAKKGYC